MRVQLIDKPNPKYSPLEQVLVNRGIPYEDIATYIKYSDDKINEPESLGEDLLERGVLAIERVIAENRTCAIVVDSDADGYTSSALLANYIYEINPEWLKTHVYFLFHEDKQHGLNDTLDDILALDPSIVICPDSASNDYAEHKILKENNKICLVLDHHLADEKSQDAIVINNQLSDYPNKEASGVCITWQFCRYWDKRNGTNYADSLIDLVALGLCADMMSLKSLETRHIITKGFLEENIKNPFIGYMLDKNSFPLSKTDYVSSHSEVACTSIGAAFFVVPFINAVTRVGTLEEKSLLFSSMLKARAFEKIPSSKRGHKNEEELLVLEAIRVISNVKNRQTREEEAGMQMLEDAIHKNNLLKHNALILFTDNMSIKNSIRGLCANKLMSKYQRPCIILSNGGDESFGSMRGYTKTGLESFKDLLENCEGVNWVQGHDNAAGISIQTNQVIHVLNQIDEKMKSIPKDIVYRVDYCLKENDDNTEIIKTIASMNDFWGQDIDRSFVSIQFKINADNLKIMKNNTIKIDLPNDLSVIKFKCSEEEIDKLSTKGFIEVKAVCKCAINEWLGVEYPQLIIEDYEIIDSSKYIF